MLRKSQNLHSNSERFVFPDVSLLLPVTSVYGA